MAQQPMRARAYCAWLSLRVLRFWSACADVSVLPNSTDKLKGVIAGSIGMANQRRTWSRKPRFAEENRDDSSRREEHEPDEGSSQTNAWIWSAMVRLKNLMQISHFPLELLQGTAHHNVWFVQDGALAHFSIAVHNPIHATYYERWLGHGGHVA
ncbi:hypothetical protein TNCV_889351 [Trichonephila clavipes]|nr:hypothetical protein TNCV_889351 [Trichonephila clavipes]